MTVRAVLRVGVVGAGRIASPVIGFLAGADAFDLVGVLQRSARPGSHPASVSTLDAFLEREPDLILDLASPDALSAHGAAWLAVADVWTVNGTALADPDVMAALEAAGSRSGRRLRLLPGAIAGLDGVAASCRDPGATLKVTVQRPGLASEPGLVHLGSARDAAQLFPHETNVAVAAALAGPGLDATLVEIMSAPPGGPHRLLVEATGRGGRLSCSVELPRDGLDDHHPVAASVIAALARRTETIWAG